MQFLVSPTGVHLELMNKSAHKMLLVQQSSRIQGLCVLQLHSGWLFEESLLVPGIL